MVENEESKEREEERALGTNGLNSEQNSSICWVRVCVHSQISDVILDLSIVLLLAVRIQRAGVSQIIMSMLGIKLNNYFDPEKWRQFSISYCRWMDVCKLV